jgi:riboflavin transporter FmnP
LEMKSYELTAAGALAAISAALQIVHVGWLSPWGLWIDAVAVSWILAFFLYGGRTALVVSIVGALIITLIAPSTWLGAIMKWTATIPMIVVLFAMQKVMKLKPGDMRKLRLIAVAVIAAVLLRGAIIIPLNYYFAIPIWTGWTTAEAMAFVPWWVIFGLNAIQGALEVAIAWLLVFRFRLDRFAVWS